MLYIVDIYAKIVIAVFGFIAPTVTLLLPILGGRISIIRTRIKLQETKSKQLKSNLTSQYELSLVEISDAKLKEQLQKTVAKYTEAAVATFDINISDLNQQLRWLDLKRQIKHIFISLLSCLGLVMTYYYFRVNMFGCFGLDDTWRLITSLAALAISAGFFSYAIYRLWTLICIVVEHNIENNSDNIENELIKDPNDPVSV